MAYLVKPVIKFVKAKNKNLNSLQAEEARSHDQDIQRSQESAGREARNFYESLTAESPLTCNTAEDHHCQKKHRVEKLLNCVSSRPSTSSIRVERSTNVVHKPRNDHGVHQLLRLCQEGNIQEIRRVLKEGATNLNDTDQFGWNALMCAAYSGHVHVVKYLSKKYPSGLKHRNKQGQSVLELAQIAGCDEVVEALQQMEREERYSHCQTRNIEGHSGSRQPIWCEKCESNFKDNARVHQRSTAHLFSCGLGPQPTHYHLPESNRGFQMMLQDGWDKEKGLGKGGEGHKFPVKTILKRDREGLGSADSDVKPRITHFKPFDTDAVKRPRKEKTKERTKDIAAKALKRTRYSKSHRHKAMEIDFRMSFHSQP